MGFLSKSLLLGGVAAGGAFGFYKTADPQTQFELISAMGPMLRMLDAETTHILGIKSAEWGLFPRETRPDPAVLRTRLWNKDFPNPLGLAAGFDKHAEVIEPLMRLGFGFVEVGSITPKPQDGNPKPRVFRIKDLKATINRYGFNSLGADAVADNLLLFERRAREDPSAKPGVLGVNLGKNKTSMDAATDYSIGLTKLGGFADYLVINISSPNTPGLRALQGRKELEDLVVQVKGTRDRMRWGPGGTPPLLVKIAPDLTDADMQDIAAVALKHKVDGLIVSNTTIARPGTVSDYPESKEAGGLSGPPLMEPSTKVLAQMYKLTGQGKVPLIGCGGISSGDDAYRKIRAGASLVQLYTALAYDGPVAVPNIKARLAQLLERDGFKSVADAVGVDHKKGGAYYTSFQHTCSDQFNMGLLDKIKDKLKDKDESPSPREDEEEGGFAFEDAGPQEPASVQLTVSQEQEDAVRSKLPEEFRSVDSQLLRMFVRATGGDLELSTKRLVDTLTWRKTTEPEKVVCKACAKDHKSHYLHLVGYDLQSRPIIYSCNALNNDNDIQNTMDHLIQTFESAVRAMPAGVEQWVWVCDFAGLKIGDMSPKLARAFMDVSAAHYPERLGLFMMVGVPKVFSTFWSAIEKFVDPKTYRKIRVIPYDVKKGEKSKLKAELPKHFDATTTNWLLSEMAENRDKDKVKSKAYSYSSLHKDASTGALDSKALMMRAGAWEHDHRGAPAMLASFHSSPNLLEPQALA